LRILVMTRFYRSGQTTHVFDLCSELLQRGHRVLLAISDLNDVVYLQKIKTEGFPHILTSHRESLRKQVAKWGPDLIHNHSSHTLPTALYLGQQLNIPTVTTVHYLDFEPVDLLEQQAAVVLISREMREQFQSLQVPTFVVENGIRLTPLRTRTKRWRQRALILAQSTPEKQENFHCMSQSLLSWGWEVLSAGNWRLPGVKNLGWVHNVAPLVKQANLVIGTGRAIREGMAAGCAAWVLGAYCDGLVTKDNVCRLEEANFSGRTSKGRFVPSEAAPFLEQPEPEFFQALGKFGRRWAQLRFSSLRMVRSLEQVYDTALAQPAKLPR
jgi:hypothetical protein